MPIFCEATETPRETKQRAHGWQYGILHQMRGRTGLWW